MDFLAKARRQMLSGQVNDARMRLLDSFAGLSNEQLVEPGPDGDRSVRDILANVAAWNRAYTAMFKDMVAGERNPVLDMDEEGIEKFNSDQHEADRDRPIDDVITDLNSAWDELIEFLREVDNQQLFAPAPGDEHADMSIAACLSVLVSEDEENADKIESWREALEQ